MSRRLPSVLTLVPSNHLSRTHASEEAGMLVV